MRRIRGLVGCVGGLAGVLLSVTLARPAAAQTYGLFVGNSFTVNGLNLTVTGCTLTLASVVQSSCGTTSANAYAEIVALAGTGTEALKVDRNQVGGGDLFSVASTAPSNQVYELLYTLSIKPPTGNALSAVSSALAGTASSTAGRTLVTDTQKIYSGTTPVNVLTPTGALLGTQALNLNTTSASNTLSPAAAALSVSTDLKLTSGTAYALKLSSVTQTYSFGRAPEPVSIGLFLVGLAGLGAARFGMGRSQT